MSNGIYWVKFVGLRDGDWLPNLWNYQTNTNFMADLPCA